MNEYVKNLNRIEFLITLACTGKCKHCSQGEHSAKGALLDGKAGAETVRRIAGQFSLQSVMTFGGEPLLHAQSVYEIHQAARKAGIPARQLITNGFFSKNKAVIKETAKKLYESGVNDVALSADAFHQETIPLAPVQEFAEALLEAGMERVCVHPAWIAGEREENPYNLKTREIINEFAKMGIRASEGNVIFPAGNALKYLREYFDTEQVPQNPYIENEYDLRAVCVSPDGSLLNGNIYEKDALQILNDYRPA